MKMQEFVVNDKTIAKYDSETKTMIDWRGVVSVKAGPDADLDELARRVAEFADEILPLSAW